MSRTRAGNQTNGRPRLAMALFRRALIIRFI